MNDTRTYRRLIATALDLLSQEGFKDNLLGRAARKSGTPLARARTFFKTDEELILGVYMRFASDLEDSFSGLQATSLAERYRWFLDEKIRVLRPYREAVGALTAKLVDPRSELGVFHPQTEIIRTKLTAVLHAVIEGSSSQASFPKNKSALARLLYLTHLGFVFLWCQDRSPNQARSAQVLDVLTGLIAKGEKILRFPGVGFLLGDLGSMAVPLLDSEDDGSAKESAMEILRRLFGHRRLLKEDSDCGQNPCAACFAHPLPRVMYFTRKKKPIHFVLPAFPAKSPSRRKTLGPLPDRAEEVGIEYLASLGREIREIYPPGVRITVCSDGHVFSDLVGVTDGDVSAYADEIGKMIAKSGEPFLDFFSLSDLYEDGKPAAMRKALVAQYARPLESVPERAKEHASMSVLVNGIHRFLFEEQTDVQKGKSRTLLQKETRQGAYEVVQRSEAWGRLIADCFPTALRLSIHPQSAHSPKIGILLGQGNDAWLTPWHGVAVATARGWTYMKRHEAEDRGGRLVHRNGRPWHFEI